jgi:release factor glutamine methyltransferase
MQSVFPKILLQEITNTLSDNYSTQESESLSFMVLEHVFDLSKMTVLVNEAVEINNKVEVRHIVERLLKNEPIQHIIGYTEFYGRKFEVNENVLIPRQETEELIQLIKTENLDSGLKILDIGTGSGCIACSLSLEMEEAEIFALDVSEKALDVAKKNSIKLKCEVSFILSDILTKEIPIHNLDIIVSNPPYVTNIEKNKMHENVLSFEPDIALYVPNNDPLKFYEAIIQKSIVVLNNGGKLYFEINELLGNEMDLLMRQNRFKNVKIHQDLNGKDRFVSGTFQIV